MADLQNKELIEQPLKYTSCDVDLALEGKDEVAAVAADLEKLCELKTEIQPQYLDCASTTL